MCLSSVEWGTSRREYCINVCLSWPILWQWNTMKALVIMCQNTELSSIFVHTHTCRGTHCVLRLKDFIKFGSFQLRFTMLLLLMMYLQKWTSNITEAWRINKPSRKQERTNWTLGSVGVNLTLPIWTVQILFPCCINAPPYESDFCLCRNFWYILTLSYERKKDH